MLYISRGTFVKRIVIVVFLFAMIILSCRNKNQVVPTNCVVVSLAGNARVIDSLMAQREIKAGDYLNEGDTVVTDTDSSLELKFGTRVFVKMDPSSTVVLTRSFFSSLSETTDIKLISGIINADVDSLRTDDIFEVETHSITVGVRGTAFKVVNNDDISEVAVSHGTVAVTKNYDSEALSELKNAAPTLYEEVSTIVNQPVMVTGNEMVTINNNEFDENKERLDNSVRVITEEVIAGNRPDISIIRQIRDEMGVEKVGYQPPPPDEVRASSQNNNSSVQVSASSSSNLRAGASGHSSQSRRIPVAISFSVTGQQIKVYRNNNFIGNFTNTFSEELTAGRYNYRFETERFAPQSLELTNHDFAAARINKTVRFIPLSDIEGAARELQNVSSQASQILQQHQTEQSQEAKNKANSAFDELP